MKVAILGSGPAGMSSALWLKNFGHDVVVLESDGKVGGIQKESGHANPWLLGFPAQDGRTLTRKLVAHFEDLDVATHTSARVKGIQKLEGSFTVHYAREGMECALRADRVIIATGTRPRSTPEFDRLANDSPRLIVGAAKLRPGQYARERFVLFGGGDNACENALALARSRNRATIIARGALKARTDFINQCRAHRDIEVLTDCAPTFVGFDPEGLIVEIRGRIHRFDRGVVLYGYQPNTDFLGFGPALGIELDGQGTIQVDAWQRTRCPGVFAVGDVSNAQFPCVATALAQGAVAAKRIELDSRA